MFPSSSTPVYSSIAKSIMAPSISCERIWSSAWGRVIFFAKDSECFTIFTAATELNTLIKAHGIIHKRNLFFKFKFFTERKRFLIARIVFPEKSGTLFTGPT